MLHSEAGDNVYDCMVAVCWIFVENGDMNIVSECSSDCALYSLLCCVPAVFIVHIAAVLVTDNYMYDASQWPVVNITQSVYVIHIYIN